MKQYLITILVTLNALLLNAQEASFKWSDELCQYKSTFDSTEYSRRNIEDCYKIAYFGDLRLSNTPSVFKLSDINRLDPFELDIDYQTKFNRLKNLELPKNSIWVKYRDSLIIQLSEEYQLSKVAYTAYTKSKYEILDDLEYAKSDSCMMYYQKALLGNDETLSEAWFKLTALQASKNGSPEVVWEKYQTKKAMSNWHEHAEVQIMTFGWWNCAVRHIYRFDNWKHYHRFQELFTKTIELDCEEI